MANEIKIKVTSDADTKGIEQAEKSLDKVTVASAAAGKSTDKLGDNFTESDRAAKNYGKGLDDLGSKTEKLGKGFDGLKNKKPIGIGDLIDDKPKPGFIEGIGSKLSAAFETAPKIPLLGGVIGAAMAPMLGAALAGAVTGAVGLGGIIGGIALVAKDPAIAGEAKKIGGSFKKGIQEEARQAFTGPVTDSLGQLSGLAERSVPKIGKIFDAVAPSVEHLTTNVTNLGDSLLDNLQYAAGQSGSSINALGDLIEHTGESVGDLIAGLSDHAEEGAAALGQLDSAIQTSVADVGTFVGVLADVYGAADAVNKKFEDVTGGLNLFTSLLPTAQLQMLLDGFQSTDAEMGTYASHTKEAADANEVLADSASNAEKAANGQRDALQALSNELKAETDPVFGLLEATEQMTEAQHNYRTATDEAAASGADAKDKLNDYNTAVKRHGKSSEAAKDALKDYNKAVEKSGQNSQDAKDALRDLAKQAINLEGKAGALGEKFDGTVSPALRKTLETAGLTGPEIDALGRQFVTAKKKGDAFAKDYKANTSVSGTNAAGSRIRSITDDLRAFQGTWTATMITNYKTFGKPGSGGGLATGGIAGAAASGSTSSGLTWVGENGPELAALDPGTRVWSAGDSRRMAAQGGGGSGDVRFYLDPSGAGHNTLAAALFEMIRAEVRTQGQGSVQRTFGPIGAAA